MYRNWWLGCHGPVAREATSRGRSRATARVWQIFLEPAVRMSQDGQGPFPKEVLAMGSTPRMSRQQFIERMRPEVEEALGRVADAINQAPPGQVIAGGEEPVRDTFADL